jgi:hypothetical protein
MKQRIAYAIEQDITPMRSETMIRVSNNQP